MTWYMVSLVGRDRAGIVARITRALFEAGCSLGETAMMRLGGNFSILMMVGCDRSREDLEGVLALPAADLGLRFHVDPIDARLHDHAQPDVRISVYGADRPGIVAQVTGALAEAGFNILDLASDVGGSPDAPLYVLHMEGQATRGVEAVRAALEAVHEATGVEVHLAPVDAVIG